MSSEHDEEEQLFEEWMDYFEEQGKKPRSKRVSARDLLFQAATQGPVSMRAMIRALRIRLENQGDI